MLAALELYLARMCVTERLLGFQIFKRALEPDEGR
jgi:hypothetical protein